MASLNEVRLIGYVETRKRTDNEGQDHYTTEVAAEDLADLRVDEAVGEVVLQLE